MSNKIGAVITGGNFQALGALRTLAKKDIPIVVLDFHRSISKYSKYKKRFYKSPNPSYAEVYANYLIDLAQKEKLHGWVIFPNNDEVIYVLSRFKHVLKEYYRIPTQDWNITRKIYDKKYTYQIAKDNNIPIPKTYYTTNLRELLRLDLKFPLVIKPSIRPNFYNKIKTKAFRINNEKELINTYNMVSSVIDHSEILVQEFIPGGPNYLYSFSPFFKNGKVVTGVAARRTRQHPMDFGHASTFAELVYMPELQRIAQKFLKLIDFYGIAEVEFMKDSRNGQYKLIEVNPRVWGWHTLAIAAGVDLPYLLYQDMIGKDIEIPTPAEQMKWIRLITDIPTVFLEIVKGKMKFSDYRMSMKGKKEFAVFDINDPLPFLAEILMLPYFWVRKGF